MIVVKVSLVLYFILFQTFSFVIHGGKIGEYPSVDCKSKPQASYPFCDSRLSPETRASDLVKRLNISELIQQTSSIAPAIDRLGIRAYNWRSNCVHGWTASGGHWTSNLKWTVFAAPIGLGATFDPDLVLKVASVTSDEGRALHNEMLVSFNGTSTEAAGLNCFSPNVNLLRDPRWGRFQESFSEDPYLLSVQGAAYTNGIQSINKSKYLKAAACAKHYVVHNGPDNIRGNFTAVATMHDLYDSYLEAFKSQIYAAKVAQIMPALSGFKCSEFPKGAPDAANSYILKDILRNEFQAPNISVISDNGGVYDVYGTHHFVKTPEEAAGLCMNATTDLDLGHDDIYSKHLQSALNETLVREETIVNSVWRNFYLRMRLGDFDPIQMVHYQKYDKSYLNTQATQYLNVLSAEKSFVLLKNINGFLPLSKEGLVSIAVIGPNADAGTTQLSNYQGIPDKIVSIVDGIKAEVGSLVDVAYQKGCYDTACANDSMFNDSLDAASRSDIIVMVMGLDGHLEGEGHDRVSHKCNGKDVDVLALPGCQGELLNAVQIVNKKVIIVLMNGGPISLGDEVYNNDYFHAVLEVFYPGALGGTAVANVLFGHSSPGGRMPVTTFSDSGQLPDPTDYHMNTSPGRTYRYYTGKPEVPFGFGLSYTTFAYSQLTVSSSTIKQCDSIKVSILVSNTGYVAGDEVVQVYLTPPTVKAFFPKIQLVGFVRQSIDSGFNTTVSFTINSYLISLVDADGVRYVFPGSYRITVAGALPSNSLAGGEIKGETSPFTIDGSTPLKLSECKNAPKCIAC